MLDLISSHAVSSSEGFLVKSFNFSDCSPNHLWEISPYISRELKSGQYFDISHGKASQVFYLHFYSFGIKFTLALLNN